jgi:hypothetical protein
VFYPLEGMVNGLLKALMDFAGSEERFVVSNDLLKSASSAASTNDQA